MNYFHDKHFTLDDANSALEEIKPLIREMIDLKANLDLKKYDIFRHQYFGGIGPNGTGAFPEEMERLVEIVRKISDEGILIKNIDTGLIDFPHLRRDGEEVYLCWKFGEGSINYWHPIDEGFPGRKDVSEL
jgi:hypothetical protein